MEDNSQSSPSNPTHPVAVAITLRINGKEHPLRDAGRILNPLAGRNQIEGAS